MRRRLIPILWFLSSPFFILSQDHNDYKHFDEIIISVVNPVNIERIDQLISVKIDRLKNVKTNFNQDAFVVYDNDKEISSQLYNDGQNMSIIFVSDFKPNETKIFSFKYLEFGKLVTNYKNRTYAELGMKFNSKVEGKKFTAEPFKNFSKVFVPKAHTDHNALFKYEGPGWESEKVGYRFYIDWRNATDIFGKKTDKLILKEVGIFDLVANDDSYHTMQDWGMDIFKVGNTLGIGSIGMMSGDSVFMVSKRNEVICEISCNGALISEITTSFKDWNVNNKKYDLTSKLSIAAGSRITNVSLSIIDSAENITTGLAKHPDANFISSDVNGDWQYIALYGKQTLNDDNLGIVLFYKKSDLIKQDENKLNYYVTLKPNNNKINYAYAAAWEKELNGIKSRDQFLEYINSEIIKLNNPLQIVVN